MRLHRSFVVLLLGLPMAAPIAVVAEDAPWHLRFSGGGVWWPWPADPRELGPILVRIQTQFPTGRGQLGIHIDHSANLNANSGTLGYVGLIRWDDLQTLAGLVQRRNVRTLVVSE